VITGSLSFPIVTILAVRHAAFAYHLRSSPRAASSLRVCRSIRCSKMVAVSLARSALSTVSGRNRPARSPTTVIARRRIRCLSAANQVNHVRRLMRPASDHRVARLRCQNPEDLELEGRGDCHGWGRLAVAAANRSGP
jgi:hypothetical protein